MAAVVVTMMILNSFCTVMPIHVWSSDVSCGICLSAKLAHGIFTVAWWIVHTLLCCSLICKGRSITEVDLMADMLMIMVVVMKPTSIIQTTCCTGTIPESWAKAIKNLNFVDLSNNRLSGTAF